MAEQPAGKSSVLEVADSVTGFEEQEVTSTFGLPLGTLQLTDGAMWARALVFILKRRDNVVDVDAKAAVLGMAIREVWDFFADESAESGKDEPEPVTPPTSSEPSAS